ncbi:MAG: hypothetical protein ACLFSW_07160 [Halobacteriales archaeon]
MEKQTVAVVAALVGVVVAVVVGSFVTLGADDAPRMKFDDGNVTVSDAEGEEVTVIEMSENGTGSYVVERRRSEGVGITVQEEDGTRDSRNASNGTDRYDIIYSVEEVEEGTVRISAEEMETERLNRSNGSGTYEIEVDGGENGTQEDG